MRVLQIVHGREPGGVQTLAEMIGGELGARGLAVETVNLFPLVDVRFATKLAGALGVARRIVSGRYDAIIAYQPSASILTGLIGRLALCPRRIVHQTALPGEIKAPMRVLDRIVGALGFYTANIVNSRTTAAAYAHYPTGYRAAIRTIEHGVVPPRPAHPRAATLQRFAIPAERTILFNIGRLTTQKNHGVLIRALAQAPDARLVVAGGGPLRGEHEALAAKLGVADRLHLLGDVTRQDVADLLAASDLFVFPSVWETFGLAAVEAVMAGLPIVATDLPVLREVLSADAGAAATFVAPDDVAGWATAIARPPQLNRIAADAIARRYTVARMIDAYIALLGVVTDAPSADAVASRGMGVA